MMQARLMALGVVLALVGALLLGRAMTVAPADSTAQAAAPAATTERGSLLLSLFGGLCLAAGGATIGIAANRWRSGRGRQ